MGMLVHQLLVLLKFEVAGALRHFLLQAGNSPVSRISV